MPKQKEHVFRYQEFDNSIDLENSDFELLKQAEQALQRAYAPYSRFKVGAAVLLDSGKIYQGNNQENVAYPSGLCAERVALFHAMATEPNAIVQKVAIAAEPEDFELTRVITPCGSCRQALLEYEVNSASPIQLILGSTAGAAIVVDSILSMLPLSFCETRLRKGEDS